MRVFNYLASCTQVYVSTCLPIYMYRQIAISYMACAYLHRFSREEECLYEVWYGGLSIFIYLSTCVSWVVDLYLTSPLVCVSCACLLSISFLCGLCTKDKRFQQNLHCLHHVDLLQAMERKAFVAFQDVSDVATGSTVHVHACMHAFIQKTRKKRRFLPHINTSISTYYLCLPISW